MLTHEPLNESSSPVRSNATLTPATKWLLVLTLLLVLVMRHDYWNWDKPGPLLFGFLPVGLWWQGLVSISAMILMWLMVRYAWPAELEQEAMAAEAQRFRVESRLSPPADHSGNGRQ